MTTRDRIGPALIRVRAARGVVGAGFLVAPSLAVTCAHVIADGPDEPVVVDFPLLDRAPVTARVEAWRPVAEDGRGDVAVLRLRAPDGAVPVPLAPAENVWGHRVRVCGFPAGFDDGRWVAGVLRGRQGTGWVQVEVDGPVRAGFSGAPVWDEDSGGVVGMLVARAGDHTAFLVPATDLGVDVELPNPFRGLEAFQEDDAAFFFGRDADVARLRAHVADRRMTLVVGPSGCGKSSLVRAGLVPLLRRDGVDVSVVARVPGADAADVLAGVRPGRRALVFVDQFEEVVDEDPGTARELLELVKTAPEDVRVVLTMRSDSLDGLLTAASAVALEHAALLVGPLDADGLTAAVTGPVAATGGVEFEDGLVERIVADAGREPGRLPLVEFALTELWSRRAGGRLTHRAYDAIGGVSGALTRYADRALWLETDRARAVLTRLARPDGSGGYVRQRVLVSEVDDRRALERLAATRLVVISHGVAELAHQALLDRWDRLRSWLDADREFLAWRADLAQRVAQWEGAGRDRRSLLGGVALERALSWLGARELSDGERDFIARGTAARRREAWTWRAVTAVVAVVAVVAGVALVRAVRQGDELADRVLDANATLLGQESSRLHDVQPTTALQLALAAWRENPGNAVAGRALLAQRRYWWSAVEVVRRPGGWAEASRDGDVVAVRGADGKVVVWRGDRSWTAPPSGVAVFAVSPDGALLATSTASGEVALWRLRDGAGSGLPVAGGVRAFGFGADSGTVTVLTGRDGLVAFDTTTRDRIAEFALPDAGAAVVSPDRTVMVRHGSEPWVAVYDLAGRELRRYEPGTAFLGAGEAVVSCTDRGVRVREPDRDRVLPVGWNACGRWSPRGWLPTDATGRFVDLGEHPSGLRTLLHWPTGHRVTVHVPPATAPALVASATDDGGFSVLVVRDDVAVRLRAEHPDRAAGTAHPAVFHPDGRSWVDFAGDEVRFGEARVRWPGAHRAEFTPDGRWLVVADDREARVYDAATLRPHRRFRPPDVDLPSKLSFAVLSDHAVATLYGGELVRWRLDTGAASEPIPLSPDPARLREIADAGHLHPRPNHPDQVVLETPTGRELWEVTTPRLLFPLPTPVNGVRGGFVFDPTGTRVAAVQAGGRGVEVWEVRPARRVAEFVTGATDLLAFVDDTLVVEVGERVQVWRAETLVADIDLPDNAHHTYLVRDRTLHYVGRHGGEQAVDLAWSIPLSPWDAFDQLCALADRAFTDTERRLLPPGARTDPPCRR
ncbi:hypothetical protein GCM10010492_58850 [Saccharothrix mutabilis subsp. mutabilis]|uniref:Novel STAND NTPase 1 domain-containing protein n=1 Tax=Saccharothrix mutabilis subsp. mutabilis TaxID=66855 RepID=A0ABN0UI46_9PSEU